MVSTGDLRASSLRPSFSTDAKPWRRRDPTRHPSGPGPAHRRGPPRSAESGRRVLPARQARGLPIRAMPPISSSGEASMDHLVVSRKPGHIQDRPVCHTGKQIGEPAMLTFETSRWILPSCGDPEILIVPYWGLANDMLPPPGPRPPGQAIAGSRPPPGPPGRPGGGPPEGERSRSLRLAGTPPARVGLARLRDGSFIFRPALPHHQRIHREFLACRDAPPA